MASWMASNCALCAALHEININRSNAFKPHLAAFSRFSRLAVAPSASAAPAAASDVVFIPPLFHYARCLCAPFVYCVIFIYCFAVARLLKCRQQFVIIRRVWALDLPPPHWFPNSLA